MHETMSGIGGELPPESSETPETQAPETDVETPEAEAPETAALEMGAPAAEAFETEASESEPAGAEDASEAIEPAPRKDNRNWFVVHTYSGYENKVKANLERRIHSMGMQDKIFRVLVPMEDEVEFKDGKRKITPKKLFPGYVLVEMIMDDQSWYVVRNTQGVTGFVAARDRVRSPCRCKKKKSRRSSSRWASRPQS